MPYRKRKRTYRKKRRRRYKRYKKPTTSRNMGPLSVRQKATLNYSEQIIVDPGLVGVPQTYAFSCNGCYDPFVSGTGHQPLGFDQLMVLYDHYVVIGAKLTAWCTNTDPNNGNMIALYVTDSTATSLTQTQVMERRYVKVKQLAAANRTPVVISIKTNPTKFLGRTSALSDPQLKGSNSSNPSEQCFFMIAGFNSSTINTQPIDVIVRVTYSVIFIEPKQPTQS